MRPPARSPGRQACQNPRCTTTSAPRKTFTPASSTAFLMSGWTLWMIFNLTPTRRKPLGATSPEKSNIHGNFPELTRLWAMEVLSGARHVKPFLRTRVKSLVHSKGAIIKQWMTAGKMDTVDPSHLLFQIWASTQTYAECEFQIGIILPDSLDERAIRIATQTATHIFLKGLGLSSSIFPNVSDL